MARHERQALILLAILVFLRLLSMGEGYQDAFDEVWYNYHMRVGEWVVDAWGVCTIVLMATRSKTWGGLFRESATFLLVTACTMILVMLATNPIHAGKFQWLRLIFPLSVIWFTAKAFHLGIIQAPSGKWREGMRLAMTAGLALVTILMVLEGIFMFVARSNQNNNALASQVWFRRHWKLNSNGYREAELPEDSAQGKPYLVLIGDSFLAGHGVKDVQNRFSDRLQARLGDRWRVHNHGENGASTEDESQQFYDFRWERLNGYDPRAFQPSLVVLCWYVNDIQETARRLDLETGNEKLQPPLAISLVNGSYLANYFYSQQADRVAGENYLAFLRSAYGNPEVMRSNQSYLKYIAGNAKKMHARFAVVLFPMLNAVAESDFAIRPMRDYWAGQGVPCLDLSPIYAHYQPEELVVNSSDAHPNEFAHQLAANAIYTFLNVHQLLAE